MEKKMLAKRTISKMKSGKRSRAGNPENQDCAGTPDSPPAAEQFRSLLFLNILPVFDFITAIEE